MKCPNCGETSRIREKDKFCHKCGCNLKTGKTENQSGISLVRSGSLYALKIYGMGLIPVSDYKLQSSANGETELCVTIKGMTSEFELRADLGQ